MSYNPIDIKFVEKYKVIYDRENESEKEKEEKINEAIRKEFCNKQPTHFTKEIIKKIASWKVYWNKAHIKKLVNKNDEKFVEDVTRTSFSSENERIKIEVLTLLDGVGYRVASAILHFAFPNKYPIMDWRVWESLQELGKIERNYDIKDDFEHWNEYLRKCRAIVNRVNKSSDKKIKLRDLDKALWQYSKCKKA